MYYGFEYLNPCYLSLLVDGNIVGRRGVGVVGGRRGGVSSGGGAVILTAATASYTPSPDTDEKYDFASSSCLIKVF